MNDNYEKMKQSIISNINAITNLINVAKALQESLSQVTDSELKGRLENQVNEIFESISKLSEQTSDLFEAYKGIVKN